MSTDTLNSQTTRLIAEGKQLHLAGDFRAAEALYRRALQQAPDDVSGLSMLGTLLTQTGDFAEAARVLERVLERGNASPSLLVNISTAYRGLGRSGDAADACRRAIALDPEFSATYFNLGHALRDLDRLDEAIDAYNTYLRLQPGDAEGHAILGDTFALSGRRNEALAAYEDALIFEPAHYKAHSNIANILAGKGWFHSALTVVEAVARIRPQDPEAQKSLGYQLLQHGAFEKGWPKTEHRFESAVEPLRKRPEPPVYWKGEDLTGKRILIWTEQGIGDEILFASMIPEMISRAGVGLVCSSRMAPVFSRSFPAARVFDANVFTAEQARTFDYQIAAGSLGQFLRPGFDAFPKHAGYLAADKDAAARLRGGYAKRAAGRKIVGISWRSTNSRFGRDKSTALRSLAPLLSEPNTMFVNLQYGDCSDELAEVRAQTGADIVDDRAIDGMNDLDAFFAQVAAMDLVVTTSNTTAHVAGALNVPAWVLLPFSSGLLWYWFLRREDSPWYPSVRLFRAPRTDALSGWAEQSVARAAHELASFVSARAD